MQNLSFTPQRKQQALRLLFMAVSCFVPFGPAVQAEDTLNCQRITTPNFPDCYKGTLKLNHQAVHDPSVVADPSTGYTYVFGSHMAVARTKNLMNWTPVYNESTTSKLFGKMNADGTISQVSYAAAFSQQPTQKVKVLHQGKVTEAELGPFNANAWHTCLTNEGDGATVTTGGHMWAPDVIFNPHMNKWCMYLSLAGSDYMNSVIVLLTADAVEGPYVYQGPVVFGGFNVSTDPATDYTHTDLPLVLDGAPLPARYNTRNRNTYNNLWPSCIDPCVFFDEDGVLWMSYGSWSGGIYLLQLDAQTGLRDYTHTYPSDYDALGRSLTSDPYFGHRIAGGYYVSGEGSYIEHIGNYYYLFMSYGFYSPDGGYEMRVFRSSRPEGPYVDGQGNPATYTSYLMNYGTKATTTRGMKLMGSYQWGTMTMGECAQGHNSAFTDAEGRHFVVYHTKFNNGTAWHEVRVHQLFVNEKGWLVAAPFEFTGEATTDHDIATTPLDAATVSGTYRFILHKYAMDYAHLEQVTPTELTLQPDGTVTGSVRGTWSLTPGTHYVQLTLGGIPYYGVMVEQTEEPTLLHSLCFTAQSEKGVSVWGAKITDECNIASTLNSNTWPISYFVRGNVDLQMVPTGNTAVYFTSSCPSVVSHYGRYTPPAANTAFTMMGTFVAGHHFWTRTTKHVAQTLTLPTDDYMSGLVAYYDFEDDAVNAYNTNEKATFSRQTSGQKAVQLDYCWREGTVAQTFAGSNTGSTSSYVRMKNPLVNTSCTGATLSTWVRRADANLTADLMGFANSIQSKYLTVSGNTRVCMKDAAGNTLLNNGSETTDYGYLPVDEWCHLALTVDANGYTLYVNGVKKSSSTNPRSTENSENYQPRQLLDAISQSDYLYLGYGSRHGSADALFDDVCLYNRCMTSAQVKALYTMQNTTADFTKGEGGTGITAPLYEAQPQPSKKGCYDLNGRSLTTPPSHGVYVKDGVKWMKK